MRVHDQGQALISPMLMLRRLEHRQRRLEHRQRLRRLKNDAPSKTQTQYYEKDT